MAGKCLKITALEKAILKHRAFEMVLLLFYIEHIKKLAHHSVWHTDSMLRPGNERVPPPGKGVKEKSEVYRKVWTALIEDGILTPAERDELRRGIDYRNHIGHRLQLLVGDLSQESFSKKITAWTGVAYDQQALLTIRRLLEKIKNGMSERYIIYLTPDEFIFESAEKVYLEELKGLERKIERLSMARQVKTEDGLSGIQG